MKLLDNAQNFQSALNHFDDLVEESESDQDAEKRASLAEGYVSALRYNGLIEHSQFKELTEAREKALRDWYDSDRRKALVEARKLEEENNPWPMPDRC
ncbi:hypothetical protein [Pseudomonas brassicacearum]|uniref:hypothetical protein n=1 Tax=Pseudomonas brassicacearum TaxID=930166 RepID=UPI001D22471B|nr:hypothetical protein [Pseudomonas brassicacearum]CAH0175381.1 hypothetical protein SRABI06_01307 [Pseudomonas brassicacearum]